MAPSLELEVEVVVLSLSLLRHNQFKMSKCTRPGCLKLGINKCSVCLREPYCSGECQKGDWKSHKWICKTLKKLSLQLQPYQEVVRLIVEVHNEKREKKVKGRMLEHLGCFAEHQFGDRFPG